MSVVDQLSSDPDFIALPDEEKRKVMVAKDPNFAALPMTEQQKVVAAAFQAKAPSSPGDVRSAQAARKANPPVNRFGDPNAPESGAAEDPTIGEAAKAGGKGLAKLVGYDTDATFAENMKTSAIKGAAAVVGTPLLSDVLTKVFDLSTGRENAPKTAAAAAISAIPGASIVDDLTKPSRAVIGENRPATKAERLGAVEGGAQAIGMLPLHMLGRKPAPTAVPKVETTAPVETEAAVDTTPPMEQPTAAEQPQDRRVSTSRDLAEQRIAERRQEIAQQHGLPEDHPLVDKAAKADIDLKTGVYNANKFTEDAPAAGATTAVDVAHLGRLNDSPLGREIGDKLGDEVIATTARALDEAAGNAGKVYRRGGDEFAILWNDPEVAAREGPKVKERLDNAVVRVFRQTKNGEELAASWQGVDNYVSHGETPDEASAAVNAQKPAKSDTATRSRQFADYWSRIEAGLQGGSSAAGGPGVSGRTGAGLPEGAQAQVGETSLATRARSPEIVNADKNPIVSGDPVAKITKALKDAKPLRAEQESVYTKTRGQRFDMAQTAAEEAGGGEAGFSAERQALKGEMPKVQFESVRPQLTQPDIDSLFDKVTQSKLSYGEQLTAKRGLAKLLGEYGGHVPQEGELKLLKKVFGQEFVDTAYSKQPLLRKILDTASDVLNVPRALMASFDLSAPFRQGVFFAASRPARFFGAFNDMFKAFGAETAYKAINDSITERPTYDLMRESGLAITDLEAPAEGLSTREERFSSNLAEKIPVAGRVVRASGRAYTGFLNKLRADVFDDLVAKAKTQGLDPESDPKLAKAIATLVNAGTGRGNLPEAFTGTSNFLNALFFSPRLMASRMTLLNPAYYVTQPAFVRAEAIKGALAFAGAGATVLSLAKLAGAQVESDPRSADFGKIKLGNTRVDVWGGFQQYVRMAAQLATGEYKSTTTGMTKNLGEGYRPVTRKDILYRQIESKEAPVASFITTVLGQQDYRGQPISIPKEIATRFIPMVIQDTVDILKDNPKLIPLAGAGVFGVGIQTYQQNSKLPVEVQRARDMRMQQVQRAKEAARRSVAQ